MIRILTIEELAEDAFVKAERLKMLGMMNTPTEYDARKKAFVEMALARDAANKAEALLAATVEHRAKPAPALGNNNLFQGWGYQN